MDLEKSNSWILAVISHSCMVLCGARWFSLRHTGHWIWPTIVFLTFATSTVLKHSSDGSIPWLLLTLFVSFLAGRRYSCIGLTGGIGSGKSAVSSILQQYKHVYIIDLDLLARAVAQPGTPAYNAIVNKFGEAVLLPASEPGAVRELDRGALRACISTPGLEGARARAWLNSQTHPRIFAAMVRHIAYYRWLKGWTVVIDAPLLFESGLVLRCLCCPVITVAAPPSIQLQRVLVRDKPSNAGLDEQAVRQMMSSQMNLLQKASRSDILVENGHDVPLSVLHARVDGMALSLLGLQSSPTAAASAPGKGMQGVAVSAVNCLQAARRMLAEDAVVS
jgi:dephospho-CoA kinase